MSELGYYWGQLKTFLAKARNALALAVASARWAARQIRQAVHSGDGQGNRARSVLGMVQGMSLKCEILLFQAGVTDLASLAAADIVALADCLPLPKQTVYDLVDQAILICAVGDSWLHTLRLIGVRTVTDLRDAATDKERLLRALAEAQAITQHGDTGSIDADRTSSFTLDALNELLRNIDGHPQWKRNEHVINASLGKLGTSDRE